MSPQEILSLASQGDAQAIATLIHHSTKRKGIAVRAKRQDDCLQVLLEGDRVPNQGAAVPYVQRLLQSFNVRSIDRVIVYGKQHDHAMPAWSDSFLLEPELPLLPTTPFDPTEDALISQPPMESSLVPSPQIPDLLKRPEAIALIICAVLLTLWDTYISLLDDLDSLDSLSASQLARRLGVETRQVRTNKRHEFFSEWTQSLDPSGIAWTYRHGVYIPKGA